MTDEKAEAALRAVLTGEHANLSRLRRFMLHVPTDPRCKLCAAPFGGAGWAVLRHFGFKRFPGNPSMCVNCITSWRAMGVKGAEIDVTLLFADIRGSTSLGERLPPTEFRDYLDRFYRIGTGAILRHDGIVDKLVGDEVIGLFFGGVSGPRHAAAAIAAATDLLERCGAGDATPTGPIPVGAGVHTGFAYVGATGPEGAVDDFTALGDIVNSTARLASAAAGGELLVSTAAAAAAGRGDEPGERRELDLRGRHEPLEVLVLRPATSGEPVATGP